VESGNSNGGADWPVLEFITPSDFEGQWPGRPLIKDIVEISASFAIIHGLRGFRL